MQDCLFQRPVLNLRVCIPYKLSLRENCQNTEFFSGLYFPLFGLITDQEKVSTWTLFTQSFLQYILSL